MTERRRYRHAVQGWPSYCGGTCVNSAAGAQELYPNEDTGLINIANRAEIREVLEAGPWQESILTTGQREIRIGSHATRQTLACWLSAYRTYRGRTDMLLYPDTGVLTIRKRLMDRDTQRAKGITAEEGVTFERVGREGRMAYLDDTDPRINVITYVEGHPQYVRADGSGVALTTGVGDSSTRVRADSPALHRAVIDTLKGLANRIATGPNPNRDYTLLSASHIRSCVYTTDIVAYVLRYVMQRREGVFRTEWVRIPGTILEAKCTQNIGVRNDNSGNRIAFIGLRIAPEELEGLQ